MASFTEPYDDLVQWNFGTSVTTKFNLASTSPTPYQGASRVTIIQDDVAWAAARFDVDDNNVPATTYWLSGAFYIPSWADIFNSTNGYINLPGFINANDDPLKGATATDGVLWFLPYLQADTSSAGKIYPFSGSGGGDSVSAAAWHTYRAALKLNGASSTEELWLDGVQVYSAAVDYSGLGAPGANGLAGVVVAAFGDAGAPDVLLAHDTLMYEAGADPGEPTESSDSDSAVSDPTDVVDAAPPPSGDPPGDSGDCNIDVFIDGVDVSDVAIEGSVTRRLNRPALATIKIPMDSAIGSAGSILKIYFDSTLFFHGYVLDCETDSGEDDGYTVYNATDPMEMWAWRVVRDDTADFSKPTLIEDYIYGPQILQEALFNSIDSVPVGGPPVLAEGPLFLTIGGVPAETGCDLTGAPTDWPMTISQLFSLLASTGCLDAVITPTEPGGGIMGTVDFYNGDYGTDLSASVILQYGMGNYTIRRVRWNQDMSQLMNKLWTYLGPRVETSDDPAGDQHWRANIQGFDPGLVSPPGGQSVDTANNPVGPPWTNNQLGECIYNSRVTYGVRMQVQVYDARGDEATVGHDLYRRLWQEESWLRQNPRDLIHVTPIRGYPLGTFDIGDIITVEAAASVRGGFSGAQRIYQYTVSWDEDGPCEISELQTSSDVGVETGV